MANELTDLDLGEWSICIDPANEDSTIEIVKSKSGLGPVLKETDMSEHTENNEAEGEVDEDFAAFAEEHGDAILEDIGGDLTDEQAVGIVAMAYENAVQEGAIADATEVIKSLSENSVPKEKHEAVLKTLAQAGTIIEKMKTAGHVGDDAGGLLSEITKANGGAELTPEAAARIAKIEKSQAETERKDAITKAKTFGFGKAEDVADLSMRIRKALGDKDADLYEAQIKQAGAIVKSAPHFKTVGEDAGDVDANSPIAKAKVGIDAIMKSTNVSKEKATAQYWAAHPEEYAAMRQAQAA